MGGVDLIVTDLDGTLWHTDDDIHPAATAALEEVRRRGPPLLVATGRRVTSTRVPLARLGAAPPAVVLNGALGLDLATGERFHRAPFTALQATRVLAGFRAVGLDPCRAPVLSGRRRRGARQRRTLDQPRSSRRAGRDRGGS